MYLLIHAVIEVNPCKLNGPKVLSILPWIYSTLPAICGQVSPVATDDLLLNHQGYQYQQHWLYIDFIGPVSY